jgi:hypothetical protein
MSDRAVTVEVRLRMQVDPYERNGEEEPATTTAERILDTMVGGLEILDVHEMVA